MGSLNWHCSVYCCL